MLAAISGPDGMVTAVQRIYLRPDGLGKAAVSEPKLSRGRMRHGTCRLAPAERELGLAEGVETGLSAMELHGIPVWVAYRTRMDAIAIPDAVERLVIFADNGRAGAQAAERAATQHALPGRAVEIKPPPPALQRLERYCQGADGGANRMSDPTTPSEGARARSGRPATRPHAYSSNVTTPPTDFGR